MPRPVVLDDKNPFATRATRPGAVEYIFPADCDAEVLTQRLRATGWWGQILGPHGCGKSTLLCALVPRIEACGRRVVRFTLARGQRRLPWDGARLPSWDDRTQVIVDGCEQLSWRQRRKLMSICRRAHSGLLVTTHHPLRLPTLLAINSTLDLAEKIVARLTATGPQIVGQADVAGAFMRQRGNLREVLFDLYDLYELRRNERVDR